MFLRKLRWISLSLLALGAVIASPAQSRADITLTVYEIDSGGNQVGAALFNQTQAGNAFNFSGINTGIFNIISVNPNLFSDGSFGSLTTTFNLQISPNFAQAVGNGLEFVVTATNALNNFPGSPGTFTNNASASSAIAGSGGQNNIAGINKVESTTTVEGVTTDPSIDQRGDGSQSFPAAATTIGNVANLPSPYSITQTIKVYAIPVNDNANISANATFGGTASSTVTANSAPVPAPAGLVLLLTALPAFGMRRVLRRKPTDAPAA